MERAEVLQVMRDKQERLGVTGDLQEDQAFVADLHVESLAFVEWVMDVEDALGIELPEEQMAALRSVGQVLDLAEAQLDTALNGDG